MDSNLQRLTATVVSAYTMRNKVTVGDLPNLIQNVFSALYGLGNGPVETTPSQQKPAVPIKKSVARDYIVCLECGKSQKTLRRHLNGAHDLTPDEYRAKWELPREYPMTAPSYAEQRSEMAKAIGLGRRPKRQQRRRGRA